ncbi:MAG: SRPBCC domain-containing protein [Phycisphaerae bacterium]
MPRFATLVLALVFVGPAAADGPRYTDKQIVNEAVIAAPRAEVWKAFATREGVVTFFAEDARVELRFNGPYEIYFAPAAPEGSRGGEGNRVLSYVPQEMISFTWNAPPKFSEIRPLRTFVVVQLADEPDGKTRVKLTHGGWREGEKWDEVYAYFEKAWPYVLKNLSKRFDSGPQWTAVPASQPAAMKHYVYFVRPVRDEMLESMTPEQSAVLMEHVAYVRGLLASGRLIVAGPCFDPFQYPSTPGAAPFEMQTPGIVVFEARDDAQARETMENDPAVKAGLFKARVASFRMAFVRE